MLFRYSRRLLREANALYSKASTLPEDYYSCCHNYFKIISHAPTYIGTRDSQVRGLFLSTEPPPPEAGFRAAAPLASSSSGQNSVIKTVEPNTPLFTIPLENVYSVSNIASKPNTLRHVTVDDVGALIPVEEFKIMAPHFYLGLQFASLISHIPDVPPLSADETLSSLVDEEGPLGRLTRYRDLQQCQANPWARMLEDEDFNEHFILHMYGGALDKWQRENFDEMTSGFHRCISAIHTGLKLTIKLDQLRRVTRLVLARIEHVPPPGFFEQPRWKRRLAASWRRLRRQREPSQVAMVPLLDLVNHSNRPNCGVRIGPSPALGGRPAVTLFSLSRIVPGQELCRHYNFSMTRPAALFRYGFLPFDLISIVELDAANEYLFKNQHQLRPKEETERLKEEKERQEV